MLKSVLVTGGGSGIGAAVAIALAERGCQVIISGRRLEALKPVADKSANITAHASDVTDGADRTQLARLLSGMPGPRGVFHAAGYFQLGKLEDLTEADWSRSFDTNVTARWALSKLCAPHLEGGRILFIGSDSARNIRSGGAAYSVAQAASETLRRALQAEWAEKNIGIAACSSQLLAPTRGLPDRLKGPPEKPSGRSRFLCSQHSFYTNKSEAAAEAEAQPSQVKTSLSLSLSLYSSYS